MSQEELRKIRGSELAMIYQGLFQDRDTQTIADVQIVFQNPFDALNPPMGVGHQIIRAIGIAIDNNEAERKQCMLELRNLVKLPHEFAARMPE
jgi:peptide/nickel transport system ATP-binding protein